MQASIALAGTSNGFIRYSDGTKPLAGNEPKNNFTGPVISYDQKNSYLYAGLITGYCFFNNFFYHYSLVFILMCGLKVQITLL